MSGEYAAAQHASRPARRRAAGIPFSGEVCLLHSESSQYRPDIDGLRAFAVLAVIAYHAFPNTLKGGFIGVDVFFVISGYLIGGIILKGLKEGTFTFRNFYARRIRRIFPALIVVLAATLVFGWFALVPDEYEALGKHVFGGASFISNFLLWRESGYFDVEAKAKPLLHLWSLGIEEQFYIFFPPLLYCCAKKHLRAAPVIIALCFLSFLDNVYLYRTDAVADFYSPFARVWEPLAGAALRALEQRPEGLSAFLRLDALRAGTLFERMPPNDGRILGQVCAALGAFFLALGLLFAGDTSLWPGPRALLPVTGAALLIAAGPRAPVNRLFLSNRFAVGIGLVSYPLYLWHWPLLSCAHIINGGLPADTRLLRVGLVCASFVLATATHVLVERPIRFGKRGEKGKIAALICLAAIVAGAGLYARSGEGMPERPSIRAYARTITALRIPPMTDDAGFRYAGVQRGTLLYCRYSGTNFKTTVAVIGDSHSNSAYPGIADLGKQLGFNTVLLGWIIPGGDIRHPDAAKNIPIVMNILLQKYDIKKVFFVTHGRIYMTGIHNFTGNLSSYEIEYEAKHKIAPDIFRSSMQNIVDALTNGGKEVYIIAENPELPATPQDYAARPFRPAKENGAFPVVLKRDVLEQQKDYLRLLSEIRGARIVETVDAFCPGERCGVFTPDGLPLYYDDDHLSHAGSAFQAQRILKPYLTENKDAKP
jgi:peptidoglycan/LPS O-acetylase OafA/YrhL